MILSRISIELTSRCNKSCPMCGRRKEEQQYPEKASDRGDMPIELVKKIAEQVHPGTIVQLHFNGEPLLYPRLRQALSFFSHCVTGLNTNGILLLERAEDLIGNIDTLTVSIIEGDTQENYDEQIYNIQQFLALKGDRRPHMVYRLLGNVDPEPYREFLGLIATRVLHAPEGSFDYERQPTIPEMGLCLDMQTSIAIDRFGRCFPCVRFNPDGLSQIGDLNLASLAEVVNSIEHHDWHKGKHLRKHYVNLHVAGRRDEVPLCRTCQFYGCPTPFEYQAEPIIAKDVVFKVNAVPERKKHAGGRPRRKP